MGEVIATTRVGLAVNDAFHTFIDDIDQWWQRDRDAGAIVQFDGNLLMSVTQAGAETLAEVIQWSPPELVELRWQGPHAQGSDVVAIEFAPDGAGSRVTIRHRQESLSPADAAAAVLGLWWADLLAQLSASHPPT